MKTKIKILCVVALATTLFIGCNPAVKSSDITTSVPVETTYVASSVVPQKGDKVPNSLVCMVNDAYMGKPQLEVAFEGKKYYGCCEMCKEKIPNDPNVRYAIDPQKMRKVDKANAYIVLIGDNGQVAYFEDKISYEEFKSRQ